MSGRLSNITWRQQDYEGFTSTSEPMQKVDSKAHSMTGYVFSGLWMYVNSPRNRLDSLAAPDFLTLNPAEFVTIWVLKILKGLSWHDLFYCKEKAHEITLSSTRGGGQHMRKPNLRWEYKSFRNKLPNVMR